MKKVKVWIAGVVGILIIAGGIAAWSFSQGPDLAEFDHLVNPKTSTRSNQRMLVVEARGTATEASTKGIGLLFKVFFKLDGQSKGMGMAAPRARWPIAEDTPTEEWIGFFALPIDKTVTTLPEMEKTEGLTVSIKTWEYGEVAEILHIGPYSTEKPTIDKLIQFIEDQGYEIAGPHEEEYLKGPGMFFAGDPEEYYTVIRYQIRKL